MQMDPLMHIKVHLLTQSVNNVHLQDCGKITAFSKDDFEMKSDSSLGMN